MDRRLIFVFFGFIILAALSTVIILYAQGYHFSWQEKKLSKTGLIALSSTPSGAAVYLDNQLSGATNTTLSNLAPGEYSLKVTMEGYSPWEKKVKVEAELVTPVEIVLFPSVPELKPLTFNGISNTSLSPDKSKVAFALKNATGSGLWILDMADRPFSFGKDPRQIVKDTPDLNFSQAQLLWSPDSKNILVTVKVNNSTEVRNYLLSSDQLNNGSLNDVTSTLEETKNTWKKEQTTKTQGILLTLSKQAQETAVKASKIDFSPDETKFIAYQDKETVVYDTKPSPVPNQPEKIIKLPPSEQYIWYPDSEHIILVGDKLLSIVEVDGSNKDTIYSGNFDPATVFPWPNGSKLVLAVSFNPSSNDLPNLYAINLH